MFIFSVFFPYHENNWSVGVTVICNSNTDPVFPHCDQNTAEHRWSNTLHHPHALTLHVDTPHPPRPLSPC